MKIIKTKIELSSEIQKVKNSGLQIGFVPTMGALHEGHKKLVEQSCRENDYTVVSIFVNPTQFNNPEDLEKYPRTIERDAQLLESVGCNLIFAPSSDEVYKSEEINSTFDYDFEGLDKVMEGKFRPGHFNGVVQIVSKLFRAVEPHKAYFGDKDFQQLAIIHQMTEKLNFGIEIVDCPIIREESGLAMSSRNERLSENERINAANIYRILSESKQFAGQKPIDELIKLVIEQVNNTQDLRVEYFEIVDVKTLQKADNWLRPVIGCIAVYYGDVRLIDNIRYN